MKFWRVNVVRRTPVSALPPTSLAHCTSFLEPEKRWAWTSTCRTLHAVGLLSQSAPTHCTIRCAAILRDGDEDYDEPESALILRPGHQWAMRFLSRHYHHIYSLEIQDADLLTDQMLAFLATTWSRQENRNLVIIYGNHYTCLDKELGRDGTSALFRCAVSLRAGRLSASLRAGQLSKSRHPLVRLTHLSLTCLTVHDVERCPNVTHLDLHLHSGLWDDNVEELCRQALTSIGPRLVKCKLWFGVSIRFEVLESVFRNLTVCQCLSVRASTDHLPLAALSQAPQLTHIKLGSVRGFGFRTPEAREVASANIETVVIHSTTVDSSLVRTLAHFFRNKHARLTLVVFQDCSFSLSDGDWAAFHGFSSLEHVVVQPEQKDGVPDPCVARMCEQLRTVCPRFKRVLVTREWLGDLACAHAPPPITCPSFQEELPPIV